MTKLQANCSSSGTIPYFEETLLEDGYGDMCRILKQFHGCGYEGQINIDHPFFCADGKTMSKISESYLMEYLKGLLYTLERKK